MKTMRLFWFSTFSAVLLSLAVAVIGQGAAQDAPGGKPVSYSSNRRLVTQLGECSEDDEPELLGFNWDLNNAEAITVVEGDATLDYIEVTGSWETPGTWAKTIQAFQRPLEVSVEMRVKPGTAGECVAVSLFGSDSCYQTRQRYYRCGYVSMIGAWGGSHSVNEQEFSGPYDVDLGLVSDVYAWQTVKIHLMEDGTNNYYLNGELKYTTTTAGANEGHIAFQGCATGQYRNLLVNGIQCTPAISTPSHSPSKPPSSVPPSPVPTIAPTTLSPIPAGTTQSPTSSPVSPPPTSSSTLQRVLIEKEPTSITLKNAYKMRRGSSAYTAWEEVTKVRIERYVQEMIGRKSGEKDVSVVVAIEDVIQRGEQSSDGGRRERRLGYGVASMNGGRGLQEAENGPSSPLRLSFRTTLEFYSKQSDWDGSELIAAGFIEPSQQAEYVSDLQKTEQGSFGSVKSMEMSVNGQVITKSVDDNKNITQSNTLTYIIAGVVAGALVLFAVGGVFYVKRRNNRRDSGFTNHTGLSGRYPEKRSSSDFYSGNGKSGTMMSSPPNNSFPPPPPQSSSPVGDYFGTIEPRPGEDDVSTLGDPYIGDVHVNQAMGGDNTVTESLMSSGNDMYVYGVTRPRMYTGDSSRMGETTINTNSQRMTFQDDGTIEEFYGTPDATNFHSEKDSNFEHITVVARSGILGIVIDNPTGTTPYVHAIKESSILNGRVHVGDLLMSVDEVDCRGMTAVAVSKLIGSRSQNPTRTLRLLRGATLADVHGDSSAY